MTTNLSSAYDSAYGVGLQSDGKIVVGGDAGWDGRDSAFGVVRYHTDGTLDTRFGGGDGIVITHFTRRLDPVAGLAVQSDDKVLVSGAAGLDRRDPKLAVARYTATGELDTTFGADGKVTTNIGPETDFANAIGVGQGGEIVAAGLTGMGRAAAFALVRYSDDGALDTTFGGDGIVTTRFSRADDSVHAVAVGGDGTVVAAGIAGCCGEDASFALARYTIDGGLDPTFSGNGKLTTAFSRRDDYAYGVAVQDDGSVVAAGVSAAGGRNPKIAVARYTTAGEPDTTFSTDGLATTDVSPGYDASRGIAIQSDGKIVVSGNSATEFAAVRYLST